MLGWDSQTKLRYLHHMQLNYILFWCYELMNMAVIIISVCNCICCLDIQHPVEDTSELAEAFS